MHGLSLTVSTTTSATVMHSSSCGNKFSFPSTPTRVRRGATSKQKELWFPKRTQFVVLAAKEEPKFDQWDRMELKFGRLLGEDPKLTLAKIMARKANPDVSFLEVEKSFYKNKGKIVEMEELPFDVGKEKKEMKELTKLDGLSLLRPVPKDGFKFKDKESKPMEIKKQSEPVGKVLDKNGTKRGVPNVILRKPSLFVEDDVDDKVSKSKARIKPKLTSHMRNHQSKDKETFSDMTLLRKPEPMNVADAEAKSSGDIVGIGMGRKEEEENEYGRFTLLKKPEDMKIDFDESSESGGGQTGMEQEIEHDSILGMQPLEKTDILSTEEESAVNSEHNTNLVDSNAQLSIEAALQGKPKRLDQSAEVPSDSMKEDLAPENPDSYGNASEVKYGPSSSMPPLEDADWSRAGDLLKTGDRVEVELISFSTRGFAVSFGSLIGFLPYRNLAAKWKFLAFESWLRQKGLDPSMYKKQLGTIGSYDVAEKNGSFDSTIDSKLDKKFGGEIMPNMKLEDLLRIYDQEKLKFLSSFVGQRTKVSIVLADRKLRKLIVSVRPKEKVDLVEKKRSLMAKLQIGDVVKCRIKKITYFGIFVEVEGVPALIHQTEVSWDTTLDPASYFKVGQIVEAKVHQLDFMLERIFLSLKEIMPNPLIGALESVTGADRDSLGGRLQAAGADTEWPDVESLIKELQQIEGIQSVSKGRFSFSPGLAPTLQVYLSSMLENQYKLLARSGNKVQEVNTKSCESYFSSAQQCEQREQKMGMTFLAGFLYKTLFSLVFFTHNI